MHVHVIYNHSSYKKYHKFRWTWYGFPNWTTMWKCQKTIPHAWNARKNLE